MGCGDDREGKKGRRHPESKGTLEPCWLCLVWAQAGGEQLGRTLLAQPALGLQSCRGGVMRKDREKSLWL